MLYLRLKQLIRMDEIIWTFVFLLAVITFLSFAAFSSSPIVLQFLIFYFLHVKVLTWPYESHVPFYVELQNRSASPYRADRLDFSFHVDSFPIMFCFYMKVEWSLDLFHICWSGSNSRRKLQPRNYLLLPCITRSVRSLRRTTLYGHVGH